MWPPPWTELAPGHGRRCAAMPDETEVEAASEMPEGHKIALKDIAAGEDIIKYGVRHRTGRKADIPRGAGCTCTCMHSVYDETLQPSGRRSPERRRTPKYE